MFIQVLTSISYGELFVYRPHLPTPPVSIAISSSQSPLLSVTPVRRMDTANFINVEVRVYFSFLKHNIFSTKAIESFVRKLATRFFNSAFKNSLTLALYTKTMQMAREEVAEVSYCYYSWDSRKIVRKCPCMEAVKFTDRDWTFLGGFTRGPAWTFSDVAPGKGLTWFTQSWWSSGYVAFF